MDCDFTLKPQFRIRTHRRFPDLTLAPKSENTLKWNSLCLVQPLQRYLLARHCNTVYIYQMKEVYHALREVNEIFAVQPNILDAIENIRNKVEKLNLSLDLLANHIGRRNELEI
ncbi:hypothetical protein PoB_001718600 [Plakobranchus ocellatus]|uniref:BLOC-1-related complex subunit 5 n=1 Tax=Plakobranchus ocellatus TaxID=259542 RepID=A0AAV3YUC0_9GAST|nr:hypothetical protein PoB_001718600 [Plakobranchus ocellatus]